MGAGKRCLDSRQTFYLDLWNALVLAQTLEKNQILPELDQLKKPDDIIIYHAGTGLDKKNRLIATGGRVFSVTSTGKNIEDCRNKVYPCIEAIKWEKGFYRKDIGNL